MSPLLHTRQNQHKTEILRVLDLFARYSHPPSAAEILTILPIRCSFRDLLTHLTILKTEHKLIQDDFGHNILPFETIHGNKTDKKPHDSLTRYTLPQYSMILRSFRTGQKEWIRRVRSLERYINILSHVNAIRFVALSGSGASGSMRPGEDLDLFIVTRTGWLWRGRFIALVAAMICGLKHPGGICLNLLFDEANLRIPQRKQTGFVARELQRIIPLLDKDDVYDHLLTENPWTRRFLPNLPRNKPVRVTRKDNSFWDRCFGFLQESHIRRNRTFLMMSATQLWLFRTDYETGEKEGLFNVRK